VDAVAELVQVTVRYQELVALENVTLRILRGEFLAVIGPNGSGKTTLVKTILGLVEPAAGTVRLFGKAPGELGREWWGKVGYVPQLAHIDPRFPIGVFDAVMMGRYGQVGLIRRPGPRDKEAARRALARVGLADLARRQIGRLSGGQRQRVLIARALATEPELLILDEPTTGVDVGTTEGLFDLLDGFHREGMTVVVVSHDVGVVAQHVDQVACVNRRLVAHGRPAEVLRPDVLECMYGRQAVLIGHGELPHIVVRREDESHG
jgi:ABC-type Mn2+/Zn2+ transport system ATPase subunit